MTIILTENSQLNVEHLNFCSNTVQGLLNKYQDKKQGIVTLVDFKTMEVMPSQKLVSSFRLRNYEVIYDYGSTKNGEDYKEKYHVIAMYRE